MNDYDVLFNVLFEPWTGAWLCLYVLVGVGSIAGVWLLGESTVAKVFVSFCGAFLAIIGGMALWGSYDQYHRLREDFRQGRTLSVEGIAQYVGPPLASDRLRVGGVEFQYGADVTASYSRPRSNDGGDLSGHCLSVRYVEYRPEPRGRRIVWLAIRTSGCGDVPTAPLPAPPAAPPPRT